MLPISVLISKWLHVFFFYACIEWPQSFFITSIDGHIVDIPDMSLAESNITTVRFIDRDDAEAGNIVNEWNYHRYSQPNFLRTDKLKVCTFAEWKKQCPVTFEYHILRA